MCLRTSSKVMEKIYKRSIISTFSLNPFVWLNPKYYFDIFTFYKNYVVLTADAVVLKKGLVDVRSVDIPYNKINSIRVERGLLGRFYGFGDVIIMSGNDVVGEAIKGIVNPENLKADIQEKINNRESKGSYQSQPSYKQETKRDGLDQIEKLAELKDKGIITEEEFTAKKKKLLGI